MYIKGRGRSRGPRPSRVKRTEAARRLHVIFSGACPVTTISKTDVVISWIDGTSAAIGYERKRPKRR